MSSSSSNLSPNDGKNKRKNDNNNNNNNSSSNNMNEKKKRTSVGPQNQTDWLNRTSQTRVAPINYDSDLDSNRAEPSSSEPSWSAHSSFQSPQSEMESEPYPSPNPIGSNKVVFRHYGHGTTLPTVNMTLSDRSPFDNTQSFDTNIDGVGRYNKNAVPRKIVKGGDNQQFENTGNKTDKKKEVSRPEKEKSRDGDRTGNSE